ncbi:kinase-like protein [Hyphopichia burtonii NRRL Y-1933]|uniref:Kinase-like protein n=1 Tax=Hyphopichia burtonii NRRL Y-1933 TaxID=984485 RepID=A0A1E4RE24_9ASCO|nr:kinase-like protein [Hyphopichia burtonii NRRL Y-1933]ODV65500.1 kinase-like protein [Hyphopichia burtonii NRRL Y-1933]
MSSYNYNINRHSSVGGSWHLPPPQGYADQHQQHSPQHPPQHASQHSAANPGPAAAGPGGPGAIAGFRNPWYSPTQSSGSLIPPSSSSSAGSSNLSQSPTKNLAGGPPTIPLLHQQSKRMSFANQLPTTYEYDDQRQANVAPLIHPPTRADNPFNQYYTNQEVTLGGADRRMSAAVDTSYYSGYNNPYIAGGAAIGGVATGSNNASQLYFQQQHQQQQQQQQQQQLGSPALARRSSVALGSNFHHQPQFLPPQLHHSPQFFNYYNLPRLGRSPLIVQYQQYQQSLQSQRLTGRRRPAPKATKVQNKYSLKPKVHQQPKYRRCSVNSIHISPVNALSVYLTESYSICQPKKFQYSKSTNPKRVLTKPLEPKYNNGYDNVDSDYILYVNDILGTEEGRKYIVLDLLGSGTFGQVVKCQNLSNQSVVAVKVIKSKPAYLNQSLTEVRLLEYLNQNSNGKNFISLLDTFMHKEHLCLVFELLASNLYELIKQNQFHGLNMKLVKLLTKQLLESVAQLKSFQMIHCDLKPENILLCQPDKPDIKVIDFGSACFTRQTVYSYIQSRFYRSPEVILGLPYTESIDMWSLGCIVGELFLGLPMFPGISEYNQIWKIIDMLGYPPRHMIEVGRNSLNFFNKIPSSDPEGKPTYKIKTHEEYVQFLASKGKEDNIKKELKNTNYFKHRLLKDIILNYKLPSRKMTNTMIEREQNDRLLLIDFLSKALNWNPLERMTPQEALKHPFISDVQANFAS